MFFHINFCMVPIHSNPLHLKQANSQDLQSHGSGLSPAITAQESSGKNLKSAKLIPEEEFELRSQQCLAAIMHSSPGADALQPPEVAPTIGVKEISLTGDMASMAFNTSHVRPEFLATHVL